MPGGANRGGERPGERLIRLSFPSLPAKLRDIRAAVAEAIEGAGCAGDVAGDVVLAIDEACQNVIRHAYGGATDGKIVLEICRDGDALVVYLRDFADVVDPGAVGPRDLADVRPGGLGTHFMRTVMDEVTFLPPPADGGNLLRMVKRMGEPAKDET